MKFSGLVFVIFAKLALLHAESGSSTLKSVQLVFRHGKKEADVTLNKRTGLLTNEGKEEMYQLGKFMRNRYKDFIKEEYDPTEIDILSSAANRCVQSGALFAYGFYEDYNRRANWSAEGKIPYEPIPVQTFPAKYDKYLQVTAECPKRDMLKAEFDNTVGEEIFTQFTDVINAYVQATGDESPFNESLPWFNRIFVLERFIDTNSIANAETAPDWIKPFLDNDIYNGFKRIYNEKLYYSGLTELKMLMVGPMFQMLYNRMNIPTEAGLKKIYVYPTHDFSIAALQSLLTPSINAFPPDPPTGSTFIVELHQRSQESEAFIQVYFRNDTTLEPWKLTQIPGCQQTCYVKQFRNIIEDLIPQNYQDLCISVPGSGNSTARTIWIGIFVLVIVAVILCVVTTIANSCRRQSNYNRV